jgi:hypothetical protein
VDQSSGTIFDWGWIASTGFFSQAKNFPVVMYLSSISSFSGFPFVSRRRDKFATTGTPNRTSNHSINNGIRWIEKSLAEGRIEISGRLLFSGRSAWKTPLGSLTGRDQRTLVTDGAQRRRNRECSFDDRPSSNH